MAGGGLVLDRMRDRVLGGAMKDVCIGQKDQRLVGRCR